jgi:hypothetical protein
MRGAVRRGAAAARTRTGTTRCQCGSATTSGVDAQLGGAAGSGSRAVGLGPRVPRKRTTAMTATIATAESERSTQESSRTHLTARR